MARSTGNKRARQQEIPRKRQAIDLSANNHDEHIDSSSDDDDDHAHQREPPSLHEEDDEPLDVKRIRLARKYLDTIDAAPETESSSDDDDDDDDHESLHDDRISRKLQRQRLQRQGTFERVLAEKVRQRVYEIETAVANERPALLHPAAAAAEWIRQGYVTTCRGHDLTPTCLAMNKTVIVSGSKDHSVIVWDGTKKMKTLCPKYNKNSSEMSRKGGIVNSVALSDDGTLAAIGKGNGVVDVYRLPSGEHIKALQGHKGPVTCVTFSGTDLFSGSEDRCIRHYSIQNANDILYMETLYGHQFGVTAIDCYSRPISVGRDRTVRSWKLSEDSHLIFRSKLQAAECATWIKENWFLTGHESGELCLWFAEKKKAVTVIENAHGGKGVASIAALRASDLAVSGANDGYLRLWKVQTGTALDERGMEALCQIPVNGYINAIALDPKAKFCVVAVGQEHRMGRWDRVKGARNRIATVRLSLTDADEESDEDGENGSTQQGIHDEDASSQTSSSDDDSNDDDGDSST